ncbi:hypothetical protein ACFO4P_04360 [Epilithonimonas pallida]|uniref:Uncharacterized protein n=1 Tax=Epilithonimonas pallida TaxID=373671 RepID=A0ABY1QZD3_9FLAO|nr:hypothetical protein [Epilithonimonas pallida]SMP90444.1 hypothetical protein SAMN05421679_102319 [Epilithonimonas pallida]
MVNVPNKLVNKNSNLTNELVNKSSIEFQYCFLGDYNQDFDFNYKMGEAGRGLEGTGRDYEGMGDDLLRDGDRVHANNMDDSLAPTPSPNGSGFAWGFSAIAEAFKDFLDFWR